MKASANVQHRRREKAPREAPVSLLCCCRHVLDVPLPQMLCPCDCHPLQSRVILFMATLRPSILVLALAGSHVSSLYCYREEDNRMVDTVHCLLWPPLGPYETTTESEEE